MSKHTRLWSKSRFEECLQEGRGLEKSMMKFNIRK